MEFLLVVKRAVHQTGNGPRPTPSVLRFCLQKADRTSELCHWPSRQVVVILYTRQLEELTFTTSSSTVCLIVLMFHAAVTWKAEFRMNASLAFTLLRFLCSSKFPPLSVSFWLVLSRTVSEFGVRKLTERVIAVIASRFLASRQSFSRCPLARRRQVRERRPL